MIEPQKAISFHTFFFLEFFKKVIEYVKEKFDSNIVSFLEVLAYNLKQADDPIEVLEKIARFQTTNEMTIFLFDMLNRLEKIHPDQALQKLDELTTDFVNLFSLMVEDEEVVKGFQEVLKSFEPLPEKISKKVTTKRPSKMVDKEFLTFQQFYPRYVNEQILISFSKEQRKQVELLLDVLLQHLIKEGQWVQQIQPILQELRQLFPEKEHDALMLMEQSKKHITALTQKLKELNEKHPQLIETILSTGKIPEQEEKGEETIDDLLKAYFYSEVKDSVHTLEQLIVPPINDERFRNIIKNLRSLKELSMIHGYSGIEFYCDNIIKLLRKHQLQIIENSQQIADVLKEMIDVLKDVEHFETELSTQEQSLSVENFEQKLEKSLKESVSKVEAQKEETEKAATEPLISVEDQNQVFKIFQDLALKLTERLKPFSAQAKSIRFVEALASLSNTAAVLDPELPTEFLRPFKNHYQKIMSAESIDRTTALSQLSGIWDAFIANISDKEKLGTVKDQLQQFDFNNFIKVEAFSIEDTKTQEALVEALKKLWANVRPILPDAWLNGEPFARQKMEQFLVQMKQDLQLLALQNYLSLPEFLLEKLQEIPAQKLNSDFLNELEKSVDLFLERIEQQGAEGSVQDLVEVLQELWPKATETEQAVEVSADEKDFIEESQQHLQNAENYLQQLITNPQNRSLFKDISNEIHAIYSGAQFLGRERIADAALVVEETAEMFSDPAVEIPPDLFDSFSKTLTALLELIENPEAKVERPFEILQSILDRLVLDEKVPAEEVQKDLETANKPVEEKPLFSPPLAGEEDVKQIFKEDAQSLMQELSQANQKLIEEPDNQEALFEFDQAIHALKNAARMAGLDQFSLVLSRMEEISEEIKNDPSINSDELQRELKQVLDELDSIVVKGTFETAEVDALLPRLDTIFNKLLSTQKSEDERALRLRELFIEEAKELIEKINNDLLELEKVPESNTVLADLLRHLHTLKGGALMANYNKIGEVTHKLEDYFQLYRSQNAETKMELLPTAFTMIDLISEMVKAIELGKPEVVSNFTARLADMDNKLFFLKDFEIPKESMEQLPAAKPKAGEPVAFQEGDNTLKIKASYLDHLINLATEMVISRTELNSYFDTLKKLFYEMDVRKKDLRNFAHQLEDFVEERTFNELKGMVPRENEDWETWRNFAEIIKSISGDYYKTTGAINKVIRFLERHISQLSVLSKSIHNDLLKARMMPISNLFERFKRPIRDLARQQKKQVELIIEDNDAEMDRAMIEALYEPLLHILRNAVDHGIEKSAERKKAGKDPVGKIILRARQEKNQVVIDVIDDGRGIDLEKIRDKIVKMKLVSKKEATSLPESSLLEYIFLPDFSTRTKTTKTSGRGIGLDVVAMEIQKLKGIVRVKTTPNQGTVFSIRVPLTLIVSHAMLIKFRDITMAIPLLAVMESIKITEKDILVDDERKYIQVRGKLLPYVDLDDILKFPEEQEKKAAPKNIALVLHDSGVSIALGIEEIKGRQDIIIKNLGNLLQNVDLIAGGTILPDGEVALILDYAALIHRVEADYFTSTRDRVLIRKVLPKVKKGTTKEKEVDKIQAPLTVKKVVGRKPKIMVVDDSESVRKFVSSFLKKHGYETIEAKDGKQALELINENEIDLLITDLQMPKMNGFKLSENIRSLEKYKDLPIIILTAQVGKKQEQKSEAVGANAFISKPFKEDDLIRMVKNFVQSE